MNRLLSTCCALAFTLLLGQITDRTTGQPLVGVHIDLSQGRTTLRATTGTDGRFRLAGVRPGRHVLHYSSDDVPPQQATVSVRGTRTSLRITACSTTLDYSCGGGGGG